LIASVVGTVERVNKLVTVKGVGGVYNGEVSIPVLSLEFLNDVLIM